MHPKCFHMHSECTSKCTQNAPKKLSKCTQIAPKTHPKCTKKAPELHAKCTPDAPQMHPKCMCIQNGCIFKCTQNALECILGAIEVCTYNTCKLGAFWVHIRVAWPSLSVFSNSTCQKDFQLGLFLDIDKWQHQVNCEFTWPGMYFVVSSVIYRPAFHKH